MLTENHKYLTIPVHNEVHFQRLPPVYIMPSDSHSDIHSQLSMKILSKSGHHSMLRIFFTSQQDMFFLFTQIAAGVASLQMYTDKVFQKSTDLYEGNS